MHLTRLIPDRLSPPYVELLLSPSGLLHSLIRSRYIWPRSYVRHPKPRPFDDSLRTINHIESLMSKKEQREFEVERTGHNTQLQAIQSPSRQINGMASSKGLGHCLMSSTMCKWMNPVEQPEMKMFLSIKPLSCLGLQRSRDA